MSNNNLPFLFFSSKEFSPNGLYWCSSKIIRSYPSSSTLTWMSRSRRVWFLTSTKIQPESLLSKIGRSISNASNKRRNKLRNLAAISSRLMKTKTRKMALTMIVVRSSTRRMSASWMPRRRLASRKEERWKICVRGERMKSSIVKVSTMSA